MPASPELTTLTALARALSGGGNLAQSLDAALATVADLLGLETGWVWLLEPGSEEPQLAAARALPPALQGRPSAMRGDCYCLKTFRAGDLRGAANVNVVWCSRLAEIVETGGGGEGTGDLRCHASVPLTVGERHLGMLNVASRNWRVLSENELQLLTTAGALVSLAIERSRLEAAEERNRVAREIHDTLAQSLAGLTLRLELSDALAAQTGDQRLSDAVTGALAQARTALEEARRSVLDLRAAPLAGRTLSAALESLAAETRRSTGDRLEVDVKLDEAPPEIPRAVEIGLYRIAQQALANVVHHSGASHATITLTWSPESVRLLIEDNGSGFDPAAVPPDRFGLVGMSERARLLGGGLTVGRSRSGGTVIVAHVPLVVPSADLAHRT